MPPSFVDRRRLLQLAVGGMVVPVTGLATASSRLWAQSPGATAKPTAAEASTSFSAAKVADVARALASEPYRSSQSASLDLLPAGTPAETAAIRFKPSELIWAADGLAFVIEPLHRNRNFPGEVEIYTVAGTTASRLPYDPDKFDFGKLKPPAASAQLGFTGFRVLTRDSDGKLRSVASLLNASILSAVGRNQVWGPILRPLMVRSSDQSGEEAPQIRTVWIEKPSSVAASLVMHAVVDTPSLAAAIRFTLRADNSTVIDTECTIFTRKQVDHFGLAPIQSTYLTGPLDWSQSDDMRPAVYEAGGVQMLSGSGEWIWRPVSNRDRLQISSFVDNAPQGFGLLQRDRAFSTFLDDENEWQRRPSIWIEPIGRWDAGEVTLVEIPAASQNNKNIVCYWRPKTGLAGGSETSFAYRQFWGSHAPARPDGAIVTASRIGRIPGDASESKGRVLVQFEGEQLSDAQKAAALVPDIWFSAGKIVSVRTYRTPENRSMRVVFDFDATGQSLVELRLMLKQNNVSMSETWLYRWTP